jgi:hypothetical protein
VDSGSVVAQIPVAETGTGVDHATVDVGQQFIVVAETGSGSDSASVAVQCSDTWTEADDAGLAAAVFGNDEASATEFAGLAAQVATADSAQGNESTRVGLSVHEIMIGTGHAILGGVYVKVPILAGWQTTTQGSAQTAEGFGYVTTGRGTATTKESIGNAKVT